MSFFQKIFLSVAVILTLSLSAVTSLSLTQAQQTTVRHEISAALSQQQLLEYALQCAMLNAAGTGLLTTDELGTLAEQTSELLPDGDSFALYLDNGTLLAGQPLDFPDPSAAVEGQLSCTIRQLEGRQQLLTVSRFTQCGVTLELLTGRDITYVFTDSHALLRQAQVLFLVVLCLSFLVTWFMSWRLTRPIHTLAASAQAFSNGDYQSRAHVTTKDEFFTLSETYNTMAETLERKIGELEEAARQKERFAASFAHELKTPMTSIIGYADMIYQRRLSEAEVNEAAGYILNEGIRLEALSFKLMELMTLYRTEFVLEQTEMDSFLADCLETFRPAAEKRGCGLWGDWAAGCCRLELDLSKTLVLNLLDNAAKSGATQVRLEGLVQDGRYLVRVNDNGCGIPAEELGKITEAFYMVDKSRSRKEHGAGLGLALCADIAALHHTELTIQSAVGQGTTVSFSLPLEVEHEA